MELRSPGALFPTAIRLSVLVGALVTLGGPVIHAGEGSEHHSGSVTADMIGSAGPWRGTAHVVAVDELYFAGQPDAAGFAGAAQEGVTSVVNIRGPQEVDWDVAAAVQQAGMKYYNEPLILGESGIDGASAQRISELIGNLAGEKVLVHCASGNRVAIWWATHLVSDHGMSGEAAIGLARRAGMKASLEPLLRAHLR